MSVKPLNEISILTSRPLPWLVKDLTWPKFKSSTIGGDFHRRQSHIVRDSAQGGPGAHGAVGANAHKVVGRASVPIHRRNQRIAGRVIINADGIARSAPFTALHLRTSSASRPIPRIHPCSVEAA